MRRVLAGSVGVALGLGLAPAFAQETGWHPAPANPMQMRREPAVSLGPPTAALGAPRPAARAADPAVRPAAAVLPASWAAPTARAQMDDKAPMPAGPALSGSSPLPPPTPLMPAAPLPGAPVTSGPFLGGPVFSAPPPGVPMVGGPVMPDAACPGCAGGALPAPADACMPPLPGGVFVPDAQPCGHIFYGSVEYLLWWIRNGNLPVLLAAGPTPADLATGVPPIAQVLYGGGPITSQERSGFRVTVGSWLSACQNWGVEGSYFFLGRRGSSFEGSGMGLPGSGDIFRPFTNVVNRAGVPFGPDYELIARQDMAAGNFAVTTSNELWGADLNLRKNILLGCRWRLDGLAGFRYLHFDERLDIAESVMTLPMPSTAMVSVMDHFKTTNDFYGGQLGLAGQIRRGPWTLDLTTKVALGTNHQTVDISGGQAFLVNTGTSTMMGTAPFGLLAQPTNIGTRSRDVFAVVPEVGMNLGYQWTPHLKLFVGYNFLYWSNVLRAGDQVDTVLDVNTRPTGPSPIIGPPTNRPQMRPIVPFRDSDFWAQGINFGLQFTW